MVAVRTVLKTENIDGFFNEISEILLNGHENDLNWGYSVSETKMNLKSEM